MDASEDYSAVCGTQPKQLSDNTSFFKEINVLRSDYSFLL